MTSFLDYYKSLPQSTAPVATKPTAKPKFNASAFKATPASNPAMDALSWLGDIISRPLYGVTNAIQNGISTAAKEAQNVQQGKSPYAGVDIGASILNAAPPLINPGMWSTDPKLHRTTSDVIEQSTDAIGPVVNPQYKDVQNNVNPWVKGIAGFAGDIALDPLTYLPGPDVVTWGKKLAKLPSIVKDASNASKAADKAVSEATKMKAPTKKTAVDSIIAKLPAKPAPEQLNLEDIKYIAGKDRTPNQKAVAAVADALGSPAAADARNALHGLPTQTVTDIAKAVSNVKDAKPLTFDQWRSELMTTLEDSGLPMSKAPKLVYVKGGQQVSVPLPKALAEFDSPEGVDKWVSASLLKKHTQYLNNFSAQQAQGKLVDAFNRPVKPDKAIGESAVHTVANSLEGFKHRLATDEQTVRSQLGDGLVDNLKRITKPDNFDKTVQQLSGILNGSVNVHTLKKLDSPTRQLFKHLGVEPDTIPVGVRTIAENTMRTPGKAIVDYPLEATDAEKATLDATVKDLTNPQIEAEKALRATVDREFVEPRNPKMYPNVTDKGAKRTSPLYAEGMGRWDRTFNGYSIYTLSKNLKQSIAKRVAKLGGAPRAQAFRSLYMPALRLSERWLDDRGIPTYIGLGNDRVQLYFSQILDHLNNVDPKRMAVSFWNGGTAAPETNLMDAVSAAVNGGIDLPGKAPGELIRVEGPEAVDAALRQTRTRYAKAGQEMENNLLHPKRFGSKAALDGDKLVSELATLIRQEAGSFRAMAEGNAKAWSAMTQRDISTLTDEGLKELDGILQSATGFGDIIRGYTDTSSRVLADAKRIGAPQTAIDTAFHGIEGTVDPFVAKAAEDYQAVATAVKTAQRAGKSDAAVQQIKNESSFRRFRAVNDAMERDQPFIQGGAVEDIGDKIQRQINGGLVSKMRTPFSTSMGMEGLHELTRRSDAVMSRMIRDYHQSLSDIQKMLPASGDREIAKLAMMSIQKGITPADPHTAQVAEALKPLVFQIFGGGDPAKPALLDNAFTREGINIDHANTVLASKGLTESLFNEDLATETAKALGISKDEALAQQWRSMNIEDPLDFLSRVYSGFGVTVAHQTLANDFMLMARDLNALSKTPRTGFVQLVDTKGKSILGKYLPDNLYVHRDIARQMHVVDSVMRSGIDHTTPFWKFIDRYWRPLLDMWKWGNTLPNPTHQFRNMTGDLSLTYLQNGSKNFRKAHQIALKVMANKEYDGYDAVAALQGIHQLPASGKVLVSGKLGEMTDTDILKSAMDRGIMPTFQQAEQLETDLIGDSALARTWKGLTTSKVGRTIGGVSEARDHYVRIGHFVQHVMNNIDSGRYKSLDELLNEAAEATRKWHPDGTDLTNFEQGLKLVIPFYSWTRKAIPLVIESILLHPGRVNAFNKASYNLAESMGVNPQSLSDPFPDDQMFPNYLTDQAFGPQFKIDNKYYAISPGIPTWDVLDSTVAGNPLQNVLGQLAPMVKAPFEVATGKNLGTGSDIHDWSDYIDQNIPGIAQASRMSGTSVTGSLYGMLTGQGPQQQYQVAKGNKDPMVSVINYLTGLGVTPMSNANQITIAQLQRQNTARGSGVGF